MGRAQGQREEPADFSSYRHDDSPISVLSVDCIDRAFRSVTARWERAVNLQVIAFADRHSLRSTDNGSTRVARLAGM